MITQSLLRSWSACWSSERIAAHFGKRSELTPREIAADESLTLDDRLWVLCRALWYLDERAARGFAIESALLVAHPAGNEDDQAQYLGLMNDLLQIEDLPAAVWDAATDAATDAARAAAWAAAWAAATAAAWAEFIRRSITRAVEWLGDYADGWEE